MIPAGEIEQTQSLRRLAIDMAQAYDAAGIEALQAVLDGKGLTLPFVLHELEIRLGVCLQELRGDSS